MFHPHTRGEYHNSKPAMLATYGSPPHAWGILSAGTIFGIYTGSPPHAWGIHVYSLTGGVTYAVHPHTRGEYI
ncbi:hypothetical protein UCH007_13350 [Dehalococcoides sp. UCH007]|nr:hypothetical protein UCH007_13350 [Dehalococcoides sp. UCH007]